MRTCPLRLPLSAPSQTLMALPSSGMPSSRAMGMMSCRTCSTGCPCRRRSPLLRHPQGQVLRAHLDLKHTCHLHPSMMVKLLEERRLDPLPPKDSPRTRILPISTMATRTSLHYLKQHRATRPNATLAFERRSVLIPRCYSKADFRGSLLFLSRI
jgi:hypothetical protein